MYQHEYKSRHVKSGRSARRRRERLNARYTPRVVGFHPLTQEVERELNALCSKFESNLHGTHAGGPWGKMQRQRMLAFANKQRRRLRGRQARTYDRMFVLDQMTWLSRVPPAPPETA